MKKSIIQAGEEMKNDVIKKLKEEVKQLKKDYEEVVFTGSKNKLEKENKALQELVENQREFIKNQEEKIVELYGRLKQLNNDFATKRIEKLHKMYSERIEIKNELIKSFKKEISKREKAKKAAKEYLKERTGYLKSELKGASELCKTFRSRGMQSMIDNKIQEKKYNRCFYIAFISLCFNIGLIVGLIALIQFFLG